MPNMRYLHSVAVLALFGSVALAGEVGELSEWVQGHLAPGEDVVCQKEVNGDYFFVVRSEGRVKSGYLIDVTSSSGTPKTFVVSWRFQDEKENYVGLGTKPEVVATGYVGSGRRMYAEEVAYRDVFIKQAEELHVNIGLRKYVVASEAPSAGQLGDDELEIVLQCEAPLRPE